MLGRAVRGERWMRGVKGARGRHLLAQILGAGADAGICCALGKQDVLYEGRVRRSYLLAQFFGGGTDTIPYLTEKSSFAIKISLRYESIHHPAERHNS